MHASPGLLPPSAAAATASAGTSDGKTPYRVPLFPPPPSRSAPFRVPCRCSLLQVHLCDCPGLVLPKFASSKDEMVAAGVIPIDKLTEIRGPIEVVARRVGRAQLEAVYGLRLPKAPQAPGGSSSGSGGAQQQAPPPSAAEVLRSMAILRGWTTGHGLPDEMKAGRLLLKDYCAGKLVYCSLPPVKGAPEGSPAPGWTPSAAEARAQRSGVQLSAGEAAAAVGGPKAEKPEGSQAEEEDSGKSEEWSEEEEGGQEAAAALPSAAATAAVGATAAGRRGDQAAGPSVASGEPMGELHLDPSDLDLLESIRGQAGPSKARRPDYKFHKKAARTKGTRGQARDEGGYDGGAMQHGKKGGLVRVTGY